MYSESVTSPKYAPFFKTTDSKNRWIRANTSSGMPYTACGKQAAVRTYQSWLMTGSCTGEVWHNGVKVRVTSVALRKVK